MTIFMLILGSILYVCLLLALSTQPRHSSLSIFELRRRQKQKDQRAAEALRREELIAHLATLKIPFLIVSAAAITMLFYLALGGKGLVIIGVLGLMTGRLMRISLVCRFADSLYKTYEPRLLAVLERHHQKIELIGGRVSLREASKELGSREELAHMIERADIFSEDDKQLVEGALRFGSRTVSELMTPRSEVTTIAYTELLGPLVLDDLHKTGHTLFPVMKGAMVIGILDSTDHSALHIKESMPVRSVMNTDFVTIVKSALLEEALELLMQNRQQLVIVVDDEGQMDGLLTLTDIVEALTGRR